MNAKATPTVRGRQMENLYAEIDVIGKLLKDPRVSDILINSDGKVWTRSSGVGRSFTGIVVDSETVRRIILSTASLISKDLTPDYPVLEGVIPGYGYRIQAYIEPWAEAPFLSIRKPTEKVFTLVDYLNDGRITLAQQGALWEAIETRKNIMISGGTGTGKTSILNALINEVAIRCPQHRLFIVEDTPEIKCMVEDYTSLVVPAEHSVDAVRGALRSNPDRIIFGELRYGNTALDYLKASNTGHPGSFATVHSDNAYRTLPRIVSLIQESITGSVDYGFVADAINVIVHLESEPNFGPRVVELLEVIPNVVGGKFEYRQYNVSTDDANPNPEDGFAVDIEMAKEK